MHVYVRVCVRVCVSVRGPAPPPAPAPLRKRPSHGRAALPSTRQDGGPHAARPPVLRHAAPGPAARPQVGPARPRRPAPRGQRGGGGDARAAGPGAALPRCALLFSERRCLRGRGLPRGAARRGDPCVPPPARGSGCALRRVASRESCEEPPGAPRGIGAVCSLPSNGCFVPSGFLAVRLKSGRRTRRFPPSAPQRPQVPTASGERAVSPRARLCGRRQFGGVPQDPPSGERALQGCQQGGVKRGREWAPLKAYGNTEPLNQIRGRRRVLGAGRWALGSCRLLFRKKGGPLG